MSGQLYADPNIGILYQQSNGFSSPAYSSVGSNILTHGVAIGDINNDKLNDIIVSHGGNQPTSFIGTFNQNSQGTLNPVVNYAAYDCPESVKVADVNSDGKMDVISLNGGWDALSLYLQDGNGGMMPYSRYSLPYASHYNPQGLAIGDINSDGAPDVAIADYNNGLVILYHSIPEALTVSSPATTGFTVGLSPSLSGLVASDFTLKDSASNPVTITGASTSDGGATYAISAALCAGQTYTVTATKSGYDFGLARNVVVPATSTTPGAISGTIMDINGTPLVGANVTVTGSVYSTTTTSDGIYTILNVPVGTGYTVTASKTGYISTNVIGVAVTANTTTSGINFTLTANSTNGGYGGGGSSSTGGTTVTGSVIDGNSTPVSNLTAIVTTDSNRNYTVSMNEAQTVMLKQPNGTMSSLSDLSKVTFATAAGSPITISADGTIKVTNLAKGTDNHLNIRYNLDNGQTITIGTMEIKIDSSGNVNLTTTLIDPYGVIIDAATGKPVAGANVTLYYANTERNNTNGKTPDTVVPLPGIDGFKPNNNINPQISDDSGAYGFMVFPTTDYYIVATKDGYNNYTSPTISVEQDIVKWDFKMNQTTSGVTRLAGSSRVDTALAIAKENYTGKVANVILATADNYPDALAGSVLAYKLNAPILLVGSSEADQEKVLDYMKDNMNQTGTVYILGGTSVVSGAMEGKVTASGFANIARLDGTDRYETSVKIADQLKVKTGTPIVLAYGENYPDALSISSIEAEMQYPILLVQKDGLSDSVKNEIAAIKPTKVFIIGGEGVIGATVESQVAQITSLDNLNIVRIAGADRYETSLAVAQYFNLSGRSVCIATGNNFPDALAGSVYSANHNSPIILSDGRLSDQVMNYLKTRKLTGATLFGGEAVVSKDIEQQLEQLIGK
ncbi:cell wall-binding repeat-containing protein [Desulfitobacterium metallireducens]